MSFRVASSSTSAPKATPVRTPRFVRDKSKNIDEAIYERKAYEFLCRQQEAKEWIEEMTNNKLPPGTANFSDILRDGIQLCALAEVFAAGVVTRVHRPKIGSVLEFMAIDNISQFFKACEKVSFPKLYMFEVTDLWERKNSYRVIHCIHSLAHFLAKKGFVRIKNLSKAGLEFDEEEIRKTKEELKKLEEQNSIDINLDADSFVSPQASNPIAVYAEEESEASAELADPDQCIIYGEGSKRGKAGTECIFFIEARDSSGTKITEGGEKFVVRMTSKQDPAIKLEPAVSDQNDGTYKVLYTATKRGDYKVQVFLVDDMDEDDDDEDEDDDDEDEKGKEKKAKNEDENLFLLKACPFNILIEPLKAVLDKSMIHSLFLPGEKQAIVPAGVQVCFQIQTVDQYGNKTNGDEPLKVTLISAEHQVEASIIDEKNGDYLATFTCTNSTDYQIQLTIDSEKFVFPDRVIMVKDAGVSDASFCSLDLATLELFGEGKRIGGSLSHPVVKAGESFQFIFNAHDKYGNARVDGDDNFSLKLVDTQSKVTVPLAKNKIIYTQSGKYRVEAAVEQQGDYALHILLQEQQDIQGSPMYLTIEESGVTDPARCTVVFIANGEELTREKITQGFKAGAHFLLCLQARDPYGNKRRLNSGEQFAIKVSSSIGDRVLVAEFNPNTEYYDTGFSLTESAAYTVTALLQNTTPTLEGEAVIGTPYEVIVSESGKTDPTKTKFVGNGLTRAVCHQPAQFRIISSDQYNNPRRAGGDDVKIMLINPKRSVKLVADVTDLEDGMYEVNYLPTLSGVYHIEVTINGDKVEDVQLNQLAIDPPIVKEITEEELDSICDHDLLNSLLNSLRAEQEGDETLIEEIQKVRESTIKQLKTNTQTEQTIKDTERKIQLLINNRMQIETFMQQQPKGIGKLFSKKKTLAELSKEAATTVSFVEQNKKQMELYGKFFYLLQTDPKYLSNVLFLVPQEKVDSFLEIVILTLYGYAFSPREEYLILNLFKNTLQVEINKQQGARFNSFLTQNPVLPKMVMTYCRKNQGQQFLQKTLFDKIMSKVLVDLDSNLEVNAVKLYKEHISKEEVRTGVRSSVNLNTIDYKVAMSEEAVSTVVNERVEKLKSICEFILNGLIQFVSEIPYGLRWFCKQMESLIAEKDKKCTFSDRASVIGNILYFRFMNAAIVSPDNFGLTAKNQKISNNTRQNLVIISKVLTNMTTMTSFDERVEIHMSVLNEWLRKCQETYIEKFVKPVINVEDPEEVLGVTEYMELTQKKIPTISVSLNEMFLTHGLVAKYANKIVSKEDAMQSILEELGEPPKEVAETEDEEINLQLVAPLEQNVVEKKKELTPQQIYDIMKANVKYILKNIAVERLGENLTSTLTNAKSIATDLLQAPQGVSNEIKERAKTLLSKIANIQETLPRLEKEGMVTAKDDYRRVLLDITKEVKNAKLVREKQRKDLERLKESLKSLTGHYNYLKQQMTGYMEYINDIRARQFEQQKDLAERKRRLSKKKRADKYNFSFKQLKERGVIVEVQVMKSQAGKISFSISMPEPGKFNVAAQLAGMTLKTIEITLEDLLERQSKGVTTLECEGVILDVNNCVTLFTKLFATV